MYSYGLTKFRRPGFSRKALRAYLESQPNKRHRCGDAQKCVVADFIADTIDFPKGTDRVQVWGSTITFEASGKLPYKHVEYATPKWVQRVVKRFDRMNRRGGGARYGLVTGERAAKELADILQ